MKDTGLRNRAKGAEGSNLPGNIEQALNPSGASSIERTTRRSGRLVVFLYTRGSIYTCSTVERLNTWRTLTDEIVCNLGRVWPAPPTFLPSQSRGSFSDVGRKRGLRAPFAPPLPPLILFRPRDHVNPEIPRGDGGRRRLRVPPPRNIRNVPFDSVSREKSLL